ncbi:MAG: MATE family efflux transporter [Ruminococcaceae bacterium]|nr:MATE family efflux transporter [Oscillospiraceae bacterium]
MKKITDCGPRFAGQTFAKERDPVNLKKLFSAKDMTLGKPWQRILEFSIPMLLGNIAQQLYNTADTVIVGVYVGDNALSAVGSAAPILNLLLALFVGLSTGAGIVISQSFGARDREGLSRNIGNCISLTFIATIFIMLVGPLITRPMLLLLDTPASILEWCADYLNIFFWGCAGFFFYNMLSGVLRGLGDSVSALLFLLLAAALNVGLDLLFVAVFHMGVPGVALATVIAQAISSIFCLLKILHMGDIFDFNLSTLRLNRRVAGRIIRIGVPSGITQAIMACSMMVVQTLTNSMGEMVIAANVIIMRVDGFAMMPNMSFGQAMSVYSGQNVGAGNWKRVRMGVRQGSVIALSFAAAITIVLLFLNKYLFAIFTDTVELIDLAGQMMRIMAVGYIAISITQVLGGVMRGAGDTVTPMWITICSSVLLRIPTAYILAYLTRSAQFPNGHPFALSTSLLVCWTVGMLISFLAYRFGKVRKKMLAEIAREEAQPSA